MTENTETTGPARGSAHGATISVENTPAALEAALAAAREQAKSQFFVDQVARAENKLERAKAEVEAAKQSLANAKEELAAEKDRVKAEAERRKAEEAEAAAAATNEDTAEG